MIYTLRRCQGTWSAKVLKARCTSGMERKMRASSMLPSGSSGAVFRSKKVSHLEDHLRDTNSIHHGAWYFHRISSYLNHDNHSVSTGGETKSSESHSRTGRDDARDFGMTSPMQLRPAKSLWSAPLSLGRATCILLSQELQFDLPSRFEERGKVETILLAVRCPKCWRQRYRTVVMCVARNRS